MTIESFAQQVEANIDGTPEQQEWMHAFFKSAPKTLEKIVQEVQKIQEEGGLALHSIPDIVILVTTLCHNEALFQELENADHLFLVIEVVMDTLIETEIVFLPNCEREAIEKIVHSSLDLLKYTFVGLEPNETLCCFRTTVPTTNRWCW